jgi:hypothetical protein
MAKLAEWIVARNIRNFEEKLRDSDDKDQRRVIAELIKIEKLKKPKNI